MSIQSRNRLLHVLTFATIVVALGVLVLDTTGWKARPPAEAFAAVLDRYNLFGSRPRCFQSLKQLSIAVHLTDLEKNSSPHPPSRAEKAADQLHGVEVSDPYRWLEDANSPEVKEWVEK